MNAVEFCYWLRGVFEVVKPDSLNKEQIATINQHLDLVLTPTFKLQAATALGAAQGAGTAASVGDGLKRLLEPRAYCADGEGGKLC